MRHRSRGRQRHFVRLFATLAVVCFCAWCVGLFMFAADIPDRVAAPERQTDAIVVLTGGSGRLRTGLDLLLAGRAERLFVSGVYRGVDVTQLLAILKQRPDDVENRISIGNAIDTIENAQETAEWMHERGYTSLRLVTAAYHMPRSLLEFQYAMPDITIAPHPVFPDHVKQNFWWAWPGTTALTVTEFSKFLLAWLRHKVMMLIPATTRPLALESAT